MASPLLACRGCGAAIDPGARARMGATTRLLLDCACAECGKRALYEVPVCTAAWG